MKKLLFLFVAICALAPASFGQRYAVIDSKYILEKLVDYKDAQTKLDQTSKAWQTEIDSMMAQVDRMYKAYQAERPMLSDEMRRKREDEITAREKAARDLQKKRFGYEGDLFKKRQELIKPIQDRVYTAVQQVATMRNYDIIFDKAGGVTLFYAKPTLDKSDEVLKQLGVNK